MRSAQLILRPGASAILTILLAIAAPSLVPATATGSDTRNLEIAAERAFERYLQQLAAEPRVKGIRNIGVLPLVGDTLDLTSILQEKLTALGQFKVVVLSGPDWDAIESELARQDPEAGFGDIMEKATIQWVQHRKSYSLPETAQGTDALLVGRVRSTETIWPRARVRVNLHLARVDTRELLAGGIVEGESTLSWTDIALAHKREIGLGVAALAGLVILLLIMRKFLAAMSRPR